MEALTATDNPKPHSGLPPVLRFTMTPIPDAAPLSERVRAVVCYLEARGVEVLNLTVAMDPTGCPPDEAVAVRSWLKFAKRKQSLRASWPETTEPEGTARE